MRYPPWMKQPTAVSELSLLWPPEATQTWLDARLSETSSKDLGLENTTRYFGDSNRRQTEDILRHLSSDLAVIAYRQEILEDILTNPILAEKLRELLPVFELLSFRQYAFEEHVTVLNEVVWRTSELEGLIESVQGLSQAFAEVGDGLKSKGLRLLKQTVAVIEKDAKYQKLVEEIPGFLNTLRGIRSVTIGVNLDEQLRPHEATLLAVNREQFSGASLLGKLFGRREGKEWEGLARLHTADEAQRLYEGIGDFAVTNKMLDDDPKMVPLFKDLAEVLEKVCKPVLKALNEYEAINGEFLLNLRDDLTFYLGAVQLIERMETAGLPMCKPELRPVEERVYQVKDNYNINLALYTSVGREGQDISEMIVGNDVEMGENGRIFILTGPNQGGKTTYIQAVGLTHVLAQAGLYVPGREAVLSPVDNIFTHYPAEEKMEQGTGRFGDETQRLNRIFSAATGSSLILLNETLSGTNPGEALYLAQDIVRILRLMETRAIFATHLHELAESIDELNGEEAGDSLAISMVASVIEEREDGSGLKPPDFKVVPSRPMGRSYARELAAQYGVGYEQLKEMLQSRGVVKGE